MGRRMVAVVNKEITKVKLSKSQTKIAVWTNTDKGKTIFYIKFSPQQKKILNFMVLGYTNQEIAAETGVSGAHVSNYLQTCLNKLNFKSRAQLACWYSQNFPNDCPRITPSL